MEIKRAKIYVLFLTFLIGIAVSPIKMPIKEESSSGDLHKLFPMNTPLPIPAELKTDKENDFWQEEDESNFKIKLLETGEGFHGDEIQAKSGETWLGLFKEKNKYNL